MIVVDEFVYRYYRRLYSFGDHELIRFMASNNISLGLDTVSSSVLPRFFNHTAKMLQ